MKSGEFPPSGQSSRPPVAASRPDRPAREKARQPDHRGASARPLFLFKKRSSSAQAVNRAKLSNFGMHKTEQTLRAMNLINKCSPALIRSGLQVVSTCPATTQVRRTVVVRRSPAVFTSAGASRLRVSLRLDQDGTHRRVRPPGQSADAGALPRWTTDTTRLHHPDAHGTPAWRASVGVGRG
jgi:hypothetical protein